MRWTITDDVPNTRRKSGNTQQASLRARLVLQWRRNVLQCSAYSSVFATSDNLGGEINDNVEAIFCHAHAGVINQLICRGECDLYSLAIHLIEEYGFTLEEMRTYCLVQVREKSVVMFGAENCSSRCAIEVLLHSSKLEYK